VLLETYLEMAPDSPGRLRAERFLAEQGDTDGTLSKREKERFTELVAFTYYREWRRAVRFADKRWRYEGGQFAAPPPEPVLRGMRRALTSSETGSRKVK
jgi:hypothetical protein